MRAKLIPVLFSVLLIGLVATPGFCQGSATAEARIQVPPPKIVLPPPKIVLPPPKIVAEPLLPVAKPIAAATEEATGTEKAPANKDLALMVKNLQKEIKDLQGTVFALQKRIAELESGKETGTEGIGLPPGETIEGWHRQAHSRGDLKVMSVRELEEWHLRDHRARSRLLSPGTRQ